MARWVKPTKASVIASGLFLLFVLHRYLNVALLFAKGHRYWIDGGYCKQPETTAPDDLRSDADGLFSDGALTAVVERSLDLRGDSIYLLVLVLSAAGNFVDRQLFRSTFGGATSHLGRSIRTLYIVGHATDASVNAAVRSESQSLGDVIIFDFKDSYRNLTLKTSLALKWAVVRTRAELIAKVDDDSLFNADQLIEEVLSMPGDTARLLYLGHIWRRPKPIREADSKWYVGDEEYPGDVYPSYAAGPGYVLSRQAALAVVGNVPTARRLTMEDTFVGICAYLSCLVPVHSDKFHAQEVGSRYDYCTYARSIVIHRPDQELRLKYWNERLKRRTASAASPIDCRSLWARLLFWL